jgi:hypothetical protein
MVPTVRRPGPRRLFRWLTTLAATLAPWIAGGRAEAQEFGFWINPFAEYVSPTDTLNAAALARIDAAARQQGAFPSASTHDRPVTRDAEFFEKYDAETRWAMEARVARRTPPRPRTTATSRAAPATPTPPVVPLVSFFDRDRRLAWPSDAPTQGDLASKRAVSDKATLATLDEVTARGVASIATVAEARRRLVDYGKPAMADLMARSTPRVSDAFHMFLLSLYESLGQASTPAGKSAS